MLTIFIDSEPHEVEDDQNLLRACLSLGLDIPYFCWHPALHSVGACRVCAVKSYRDEKDDKGRIIMSCTTPVQDGMRISIEDPEAKRFRAAVIELLMINHPHDCPVCDEGGECHLQDMTLMTGHNYRRYRFPKRTHVNQDLGPFVHHEMNRCIQCYRCVRFYRDYAGGRDLDVTGTHDHVYFGRHEDGRLESGFAGNLVEVCPTGVFTDATLRRHYTRKWDLQSAPSICVHCGLGCNTIAGERYGALRCVRNRFNGEVNGYFLCDRGRFGYGFAGSEDRVSRIYALGGKPSRLGPAGSEEALSVLGEILHFGNRVLGFGSPRASLEANHALRMLVGEENFYAGVSPLEAALTAAVRDILDKSHVTIPTPMEAGTCDAVLVLGEDVSNTAPRLALALRQSVIEKPFRQAAGAGIPFWEDKARRAFIQDEKGPFYVAAVAPTDLDDIAAGIRLAPPVDLARLGFAVAHSIDPSAPGVPDLPEEDAALAEAIAGDLLEAERPLVVSGTGCLSEEVLRAAHGVAVALRKKDRESFLVLVTPECNSLGLALMDDRDLDRALDAVAREGADAAIILENDLRKRMTGERFEDFCGAFRHIVAVDHIATTTSSRATLLLPSAPFAESDGTYVNMEGRAQKAFRAFMPSGDVMPAWMWMKQMMSLTGHRLAPRARDPEAIMEHLGEEFPDLAPAADAAPPASFRISGQKIARQPSRFSGRTAMDADRTVHEPQAPPDPDSPLSFTMEGYPGVPPAPLVPRYRAPGWNSPQAVDRYQARVGESLAGGDPGVRLLKPARGGPMTYHGDPPEAFRAREGRLYLVPLYHIFGSEELSALAPEIAHISPAPYVALNPEDAEKAGALREGAVVRLAVEGITVTLPVRLVPGLRPGVAGIPAGLRGTEQIGVPAWAEIRGAGI